ncbi:MAG: acyl-CoA/acyl-ACP dehydrogenase [Chloroflexi bacterium]|nr:acyl-CoA/acyl-ACP dehydrogenase [Chloroflexota bacterium]
MDMTFSEEQQMLRQMARDFLTQKCPRGLVRAMEKDERGYSPELWDEIAGLGWLGLVLPEKYGGSGMGFLELAILLEEMGRVCFSAPFLATSVLGGLTILESGNDGQKQKYLPLIAAGKAVFSLALTEPDGLYGPESIQTAANTEENGFIITGTKLFVPEAHVADFILCVARTDARPESGISIFIVDKKSPGVKCTALKTLAGDKQFEVVFDRVAVPKQDLLGGLNCGWEAVNRIIDKAALAKCAEMLGGMQQVLDMTVAYAKERKQFDRPIGSFQVIQHYCAAMATEVEGARFGVYRAAWALSKGLPCRKEIAVAKAFVSDASHRLASLAHQIHGAIGITMDHDLQLYTRRLKAGALSFGDADFYREVVAREMRL